jgi:anti-sigma B factor antagonist
MGGGMNTAGCLAAGAADEGQSQAAGLGDGGCRVRWADNRAVVTLPAHIQVSGAGRVREQLLTVINRGAVELIVDMTATLSCDYAGQDAVACAYQRAVASGTQLRLAIAASIVRRGFRVSGLDQLVPVYPTLEAAIAASVPPLPTYLSREGKKHAIAEPALRNDTAPAAADGHACHCQDLLDQVVCSLFSAGLSLDAVTGKSLQAASQQTAQALRILDDAIRDIRSHLFHAHLHCA